MQAVNRDHGASLEATVRRLELRNDWGGAEDIGHSVQRCLRRAATHPDIRNHSAVAVEVSQAVQVDAKVWNLAGDDSRRHGCRDHGNRVCLRVRCDLLVRFVHPRPHGDDTEPLQRGIDSIVLVAEYDSRRRTASHRPRRREDGDRPGRRVVRKPRIRRGVVYAVERQGHWHLASLGLRRWRRHALRNRRRQHHRWHRVVAKQARGR